MRQLASDHHCWIPSPPNHDMKWLIHEKFRGLSATLGGSVAIQELLEIAGKKILLFWSGRVYCCFDDWCKTPLLVQLISFLDPCFECSMVLALIFGPSSYERVAYWRWWDFFGGKFYAGEASTVTIRVWKGLLACLKLPRSLILCTNCPLKTWTEDSSMSWCNTAT